MSWYRSAAEGGYPGGDIYANCPSGKKVLGGGFYNFDGHGIDIRGDAPTYGGTGWNFRSHWNTGHRISIYAICAYAN